jgi:hypothetical protein
MTTIETQLEVAMRALRWLAQCDDLEAREMARYAISAISEIEDEDNQKPLHTEKAKETGDE